MSNYATPPVTFVRGSGSELFDDTGKRYIDMLGGLAVTSLGHSHPRIADAIAQQSRTLLHVSNLFGTEPHLEVAERLNRLIDSGPGKVLFQNSGAEANEGAIKLARKFNGRGRHVVVSAFRSFHGRTMATLAATGQPEKHEPFQPLPEGFRHAQWGDVEAFDAALDETVGAILVEPLQGEGGVNEADSAFFGGLRAMCDERGMLLIFDEVQTGLARTGEWFGFQHYGIQPDIVTMAKALGNGVPIGAVWARDDVAAAFKPGDHGSTFGGQPLAASAAREVLRVMEEMDAPAVVRERGEALRRRLDALDGIESIRGLGLLLAATLTAEVLEQRSAADVNAALLENGVVANAVNPTSLRFAPAFTISDAELDEVVGILARILENGS
ncbi:MAG: acetylornithine/succinylornithine family transaminase [Acidobacteria bacterium]|nr:acetylornithine/succinylornithine family transaminase [Acidobacteriota bacterium]